MIKKLSALVLLVFSAFIVHAQSELKNKIAVSATPTVTYDPTLAGRSRSVRVLDRHVFDDVPRRHAARIRRRPRGSRRWRADVERRHPAADDRHDLG